MYTIVMVYFYFSQLFVVVCCSFPYVVCLAYCLVQMNITLFNPILTSRVSPYVTTNARLISTLPYMATAVVLLWNCFQSNSWIFNLI